MIVINCHLQTCKECWRSGDKRVNLEEAALLAQRRETDQHCRADESAEYLAATEMAEEEGLSQDEDDFNVMHPSRPTTPELDLDPEQMPRWLFGEEVIDVTRACEPVKPEKIWKNYRARREKTDWYLVEGKSLKERLASNLVLLPLY